MDQLSIVADNLEQIDVTYMTESVTNLAVTGTESLETAMRQVTAALENLNKLDIDTLNQSIADLGAIVEPMARAVWDPLSHGHHQRHAPAHPGRHPLYPPMLRL